MFQHSKRSNFLTTPVDDRASRDAAVKEIVEHLKSVRIIVTLQQLQKRFANSRIPVEELSKHKHVEASVELDRFKYIPIITRSHGEFITNKIELVQFLRKHDTGIKIVDLIDAYPNIDMDIYNLEKDGSLLIINPKPESTKEISATARANKEREAQSLPKWHIADKDPRVIFPSTWLDDESNNSITTGQVDQKFIGLWKGIKMPHTEADITSFLQQRNHEILPPKASR